MPTYPALHVQSPNIPGIMQQAAQAAETLRGSRTRNRLMEAQTRQAGQQSALQAAGQQFAGGVAAGDPEATKSMAALDPVRALKIQQAIAPMSKAQRYQTRQRAVSAGQMALSAINTLRQAPPLEQAGIWQSKREQASAAGFDVSQLPQQYGPDVIPALEGIVINGVELGEAIDKFGSDEAQKAPSGYRWKGENLEAIPGGPGQGKPLAIERKLELAGIDPNSEQGRELILADLAGQQIEMEQTENGLTLRIGKGASGMEKGTKKNIEGDLREAQEGLARLSSVQQRFKPEFQEIPTRLGTAWSALKEKLTIGDVGPEDQAALTEFTAYKRDAIDNINRYIKEITGAQMSEGEAQRLTRGIPNPGAGIFDGDSPTEFQAKMDATIKSLRMASARYTYALQNGLNVESIPLGGIKGIMEARMNEMIDEVKATNPDITPEALDDYLRQQISVEFGLTGF